MSDKEKLEAPSKEKAKEIKETASHLLKIVREMGEEQRLQKAMLDTLSLDSHLDHDLGFDSLTRAELLSRSERYFKISLPEKAFTEAETVQDLLNFIISAEEEVTVEVPETVDMHLTKLKELPAKAETLIEVINWHADHHPERSNIIICEDPLSTEEHPPITYGALRENATSVASGLQQLGIKKGDTVALMLPTGKDYFFSFYGLLLAGAIPVPIYPPTRPSQIEEHLYRHANILLNCQASMMIVDAETKKVARLLKPQVPNLKHIVTAEELSDKASLYKAPNVSPDDITFLQYTSGSTGSPKGVILTHKNILNNIRIMGRAIRMSSEDTFVSWLPLYHDMGLIGACLGSFYHGSLLVIMSPISFLSHPERWLWAIHRYKGTMTSAPNFAYEFCFHRISDYQIKELDLSSLRLSFNGAEQVSPDTIDKFCKRFGKYGYQKKMVTPVYGLAEVALGLLFPSLQREPTVDRIKRDEFERSGKAIPADENDKKALKFVTCGYPLAGYEVRIIDGSGYEPGERQQGRLQFKGPSATSGYFNNPEATRELFDGSWLESGDLAYWAHGEVFITGRTKDIIIRGGRNIYPHELEEAIGEIPGIRKGCVAAFGLTDPKTSTEKLVIVAETRKPDERARSQMKDEIIQKAADIIDLPPDEVILAPPHSVLKTSSGKIRRSATREIYEKGEIYKPTKSVPLQITRLLIRSLLLQIRRQTSLAGSRFYAAYAWTLMAFMAPLVWGTVIFLPKDPWRWKFMQSAGRLLFKATGIQLTVKGKENIPPPEKPCVMVANHSSYLDVFAIVAAIPRPLSFIAKAELSQSLFLRPFLGRLHTIYVERFNRQKGISDARSVTQKAKEGKSLFVFPEGTFVRNPGLLPFHMSAFLTSIETNLPLLPIAIHGTRSILRPDSWFPRKGSITITIGKPIAPQQLATEEQMDQWKKALKLRDQARSFILEHCDEPDLAAEETYV